MRYWILLMILTQWRIQICNNEKKKWVEEYTVGSLECQINWVFQRSLVGITSLPAYLLFSFSLLLWEIIRLSKAS